MPAVRISITTSEYLSASFSWYEIFGSQTNLALANVVADAEFSELGFSTAFIHPNLNGGETWYYWVRAAYDDGASYSAIRSLGSILIVESGSSATSDDDNFGDVYGPASSTNLAIVLFNGTTGKLIKDSLTTIDTDGTLTANSDSRIATQKAVKTYVDRRSYTLLVLVTDPQGAALTTGDGKVHLRIGSLLNGYNLSGVAASVSTVSSSGIVTIQIANETDSVDMLSTKLTIDASERDSSTAATPAVIDGAHDDVATADDLRIDIDVAGTGAKGLQVELTFTHP